MSACCICRLPVDVRGPVRPFGLTLHFAALPCFVVPSGWICAQCEDAIKDAPADELRMRLESALLRVVADVKRAKMRPPPDVKSP